MAVNQPLRDDESKGVPEQASEPFSGNGDQHGAVPASPAVAQAPGASSSEPPAPAEASEQLCTLCGAGRQADGLCANGHPVCRCGAPPNADREGFCTSNHPFKGHGGKLSLKHGLYAQQPTDPEVASMTSAAQRHQVLRQLFDAISRDAARYADASRTHRLNAREQAHLLNMLDRLREIDDRLRQHDAATTEPIDDGQSPADLPRRLARIFANEPDLYCEFLVAMLEADRDRCGPLRQQLRIALDQFEPTGVPVWRDDPADADEVIL